MNERQAWNPTALSAEPGFARREPCVASLAANLKEGARGGKTGFPPLEKKKPPSPTKPPPAPAGGFSPFPPPPPPPR
jgi:hypothetical protein